MIYISKGMVCKGSTEELLEITHRGQSFQLTGALAYIWLNGRYGFSQSKNVQEEAALRHLVRMGLAECEDTDTALNRYRILSRCILCPVKKKGMPLLSAGMEKNMMLWLTRAGLRLSTAELVYLFEHRIQPTEDLLYEENRQALVEHIYTVDTIADNVLETQMEQVQARDSVVRTLLQLLRKKRLVVL